MDLPTVRAAVKTFDGGRFYLHCGRIGCPTRIAEFDPHFKSGDGPPSEWTLSLEFCPRLSENSEGIFELPSALKDRWLEAKRSGVPWGKFCKSLISYFDEKRGPRRTSKRWKLADPKVYHEEPIAPWPASYQDDKGRFRAVRAARWRGYNREVLTAVTAVKLDQAIRFRCPVCKRVNFVNIWEWPPPT